MQTDFAPDPETLAELNRLEELARQGIAITPEPDSIAFIVRFWCGQLSWKQQTLASFARISLATVERVERGQPVSTESLERIQLAHVHVLVNRR